MNEREIAERLIQFALASTVAIGVAAKTPTDDPHSFRSASAALIRLSGVPILITAWHVIEAYRVLAAQRDTQFFFADCAIDPIERLHCESQDVDLAVILAYDLRIRSDRNEAVGIPDVHVYEPAEWPPTPPRAGDSIFFAGWPEVGRSVDVPKLEATFQPYAYVGATISDVTKQSFTIPIDRTRIRGITGRETQQQLQEKDLSGLSGAPIFRDMSAVGRPHELVGFIKEFAPNWDVFIATSALHIQADLQIIECPATGG
jgi:hypothetical protein